MDLDNSEAITDDVIIPKIYLIRGVKVMFDRDLAALYGVETRVLNQSVKRNLNRFPDDFMFQLTKQELLNWISQFVISNLNQKMGLRKLPLVFTEHGVAMLSSVLRVERAINVNIQIIRTFSRIRKVLLEHTELKLEIENIKKKLDNQDKNLEVVFQYLDELIDKEGSKTERTIIGYKIPRN